MSSLESTQISADTRAAKLERLYSVLGYRPLSKSFAKLEIWLGLIAVWTGLILSVGVFTVNPVNNLVPLLSGGFVLFVCGAYLALAGTRSLLYQSQNEIAAHLLFLLETRRSEK